MKMMAIRTNRIRALLLLLVVLPGHVSGFNLVIGGQEVSSDIGGNVGGYDQVRFAFEYGLPQGRFVGQSEVEALMCRTQEYLTEMLYNEFQDSSLTVKATSIKWEFAKDDPLPVKVGFTAMATSNETTMPSPEEIRDSLSGLDMGTYLTNYVKATECPTGFSEATEVAYEVNLTPEVDGDVAEATCQSTCAPTQTPGTPTGKSTSIGTVWFRFRTPHHLFLLALDCLTVAFFRQTDRATNTQTNLWCASEGSLSDGRTRQ
jgi:hypothetical protein